MSGVGHEYTSRTFSCGSFGFALLLVDGAADCESRELEPKELRELWATACGDTAAMASTAAVAMWKVFMGLEREVRQWWELEILQLFQVQAGVAIHVPSYDASAYA